jgi:single-strand DNA-binding protein
LQTSIWEDRQNGEKKYRMEIVARDIVLLGSRDNGQKAGGEIPSEQRSPQPTPAIADDDIPFWQGYSKVDVWFRIAVMQR